MQTTRFSLPFPSPATRPQNPPQALLPHERIWQAQIYTDIIFCIKSNNLV